MRIKGLGESGRLGAAVLILATWLIACLALLAGWKYGDTRETLLQVRQSSEDWGPVLSGLSRSSDPTVARETKSDRRAAAEGAVKGLRQRLQAPWQVNTGALQGVREYDIADAPSRLSRALDGAMVMPAVSSKAPLCIKRELFTQAQIAVGHPASKTQLFAKGIIAAAVRFNNEHAPKPIAADDISFFLFVPDLQLVKIVFWKKGCYVDDGIINFEGLGQLMKSGGPEI